MVLPSHLTDGTACCSPFAISTLRATQLLSLCQPTTRHGTGSVMQGRRRSDAIRGVISKPRDNKKHAGPLTVTQSSTSLDINDGRPVSHASECGVR